VDRQFEEIKIPFLSAVAWRLGDARTYERSADRIVDSASLVVEVAVGVR